MNLDKTDIHILNSLSIDGRKSFTDLAQELDVSVGMVRNRYKHLVEEGILHVVGWVDPEKSGMNAYARVVLKVRPTEMIEEVAKKLSDIPEVSFVALTTGSYDLEINVTCRTNRDLLDLMNNNILTIEGVFETSTTMYLKIYKWAARKVYKNGTAASKGSEKNFILDQEQGEE